MQRGDQRVGRDEVVVLEEVAAHLGGKEDDAHEDDHEPHDAHDIVHRVVGVEGDAVERATVLVLLFLDLDAVGVVGADFVQGDDVGDHQAEQHQRNRDHMKREEAVERCIGHHVVAADPEGEIGADEGDGREEVHDHLGAPERHLTPGEQIAHEGLGHQAQEDADAEDPDEFTGLAIRAIHQRAHHVQVDDDKEHRGAGGVHVADEPTARHFAHDVLDRLEGVLRIGLVVHDQENAGHDLQHEHQHGQ